MSTLSVEIVLLFSVLLAIIAFMYASVGHGGASGYIALMALFSFSMEYIKPTALVLNIFISGISFWYFKKYNHFKWPLFYAFSLSSVPAAFIGGYISVDPKIYKIILGVFLLFAIARMFGVIKIVNLNRIAFSKPLALSFGLIIGLFSGMIGIGGGIILSPLIILLGWGSIKTAAAVSALFIFVNSISGIMGYSFQHTLDLSSFYFVPVALIGGAFGAFYGSNKGSSIVLKRMLSAVLIIASIKLFVL